MTNIIARFAGKCAVCYGIFNAGDTIHYDGNTRHVHCKSQAIPAAPVANPRRQAENDNEKWAELGILTIAGLDPDRARCVNGVGFSKFDGEFGHRLAEAIQEGRGLTNRQWAAAIKLATKYRKQIGLPPVLQPSLF